MKIRSVFSDRYLRTDDWTDMADQTVSLLQRSLVDVTKAEGNSHDTGGMSVAKHVNCNKRNAFY